MREPKRNKILHILPALSLGLLLALFPADLLNAQANVPDVGDPNQTAGANPFATDTPPTQPDSLKKKKERKPLDSYFFDDSTKLRPNFAWHVDTYYNKVHMTTIDTALIDSHITYPYLKRGVGDAYQGSVGQATIPLNYFDRPQFSDFVFAQPYYSYLWLPETTSFYNVKQPFSQFSYSWGGQKKKAEDNFSFIHAQNISPSTGFNISYNSRGKRGDYNNQKGRAKNLSLALSHTGKRYSIHAGYIYNTNNNRENGGIFNDREVTDTIVELPENITVWLRDSGSNSTTARSVVKNNAYYVVQSFGMPLRRLTEDEFSIAGSSSIFFGHSFAYSRWNKKYHDQREYTIVEENKVNETTGQIETIYHEYYKNWYIDPRITNDSIFESRLTNRVFIQLQPFDRDGIVGLIDAGLGMDNHYYYQFHPQDYLTGNTEGVKETSYYVYGSVDGKFRRYFNWGADLKFHPTGYREGDLNIGGRASISAYIRNKPITLSGKFYHEQRSADYWSQNLFSNHYVWSNSFGKENETRFEASLKIPAIDLEIGGANSVVSNKVYYDANCEPAQYTGAVNVTGVYVRKDFRIGGLHLENRVLLQWSTSQEIIPVPLGSAFLSYYYQFNVVRDVLRVQIGLDLRYNTLYYAFGYNPAQAVFYNQREKELGEYPIIDAFLSAKWKRMRILLRYDHLSENMLGSQRNYFTLLHYPQNRGVLKLGISWNFYD